MRILSLVAAGVLALSFCPPTWASPARAGNPPVKSDPAKRVEKPKPPPPKPAAKPKAGTPRGERQAEARAEAEEVTARRAIPDAPE